MDKVKKEKLKSFGPCDGTKCPVCGSSNMHGDCIDVLEVDGGTRNCQCGDCAASWTEILKVVSYDNLEVPSHE